MVFVISFVFFAIFVFQINLHATTTYVPKATSMPKLLTSLCASVSLW